jgi:hypothetical protein
MLSTTRSAPWDLGWASALTTCVPATVASQLLLHLSSERLGRRHCPALSSDGASARHGSVVTDGCDSSRQPPPRGPSARDCFTAGAVRERLLHSDQQQHTQRILDSGLVHTASVVTYPHVRRVAACWGMTWAARSICDGRCGVSSSWTPGARRRDDHAARHALRRPRPTRRFTVVGRARIIYIHYIAFDSYIFLIVRCGRDAATRRPARPCRLVTFRLSILSRRRLSCPGGKLMTGQHRQPKARTTPRRPGTPMYTDQCCEDMLKARTPHTTMQNAPKAKRGERC